MYVNETNWCSLTCRFYFPLVLHASSKYQMLSVTLASTRKTWLLVFLQLRQIYMNYNTYTGYQYMYFTKTFTKNGTLLGLVNVPQFPCCYSLPNLWQLWRSSFRRIQKQHMPEVVWIKCGCRHILKIFFSIWNPKTFLMSMASRHITFAILWKTIPHKIKD